MPRYFFNVLSSEAEEIDVVGRHCSNDMAALQEAMIAASDVVKRRLAGGSFCPAGTIEVEDERHRPILSLPLRAAAY
ncbi:MAG TPA: hypothetical protein VGB79_06975 [Allosphingosinicella sp.]